jgi:putative ABC transport system permease protein
VQQHVARLVPNRPLGVQAVADQVSRQTGGIRANAAQLVGIASAGLFLALVGLYAVLSYAVSRRTRELGIRCALGATARSVVGLVLKDALTLGALGVGLGLSLAWLAVRQLQPALYGTAPGDPIVYSTCGALALVSVVISAWIPARRASRVSPLTALRG